VVYELEIDAITGKIKEFERDDHDDDNKKTIDGRISVDKAKSIALGLTGGGEVKEFELDDDEYEIEIIAKGIEYEITIDSKTGEIKEFEKDVTIIIKKLQMKEYQQTRPSPLPLT